MFNGEMSRACGRSKKRKPVARPEKQTVIYPRFKINSDHTILTHPQVKELRCIFDKRRLIVSAPQADTEPNQFPFSIDSVPLGYMPSNR